MLMRAEVKKKNSADMWRAAEMPEDIDLHNDSRRSPYDWMMDLQ